MMDNLDAALVTCLAEIEAGSSLEECLARYGDQADELRELLTLAAEVQALPVPHARPEVKAAQMQQMLAAVERQPAVGTPRPNLFDRLRAGLVLRPAWQWAMALVIALVLLFGGGWASVSVSANSLPGDLLYPVKRAQERIELSLTTNSAAKERLRETALRERIEETRAILNQNRRVEVEFAGILQEITADRWQVGEFVLALGPDTVISGVPERGELVQVRARALGDGRLLALTLRVEAQSGPRPGLIPDATPTLTPSSTPQPEASATPSSTPTPTSVPATEEPEPDNEPTATRRPTREGTRPSDRTPRPTMTRPPDHTPQATGEGTRQGTRLPDHTPQATRPPDHTPQATGESTRPPDHTPQATGEGTRPPDHTPQATGESTRPPDHTPQATGEGTRLPDHTPQATRGGTRQADPTPQATRS